MIDTFTFNNGSGIKPSYRVTIGEEIGKHGWYKLINKRSVDAENAEESGSCAVTEYKFQNITGLCHLSISYGDAGNDFVIYSCFYRY